MAVGETVEPPVYWLLVSFAAYRALYQLIRAPHLWEKTPHSARPAKEHFRPPP